MERVTTAPTSALTDPSARPRVLRRRGFTLAEVLVVIGIILVLMSLLIPSLNRVAGKASRTAALADLAAIGQALEAYKADFGDYPRVRVDPGLATAAPTPTEQNPYPPSGAQVLCTALYGPLPRVDAAPAAGKRPRQDGADGLGFRTRPGGKIYPPYLPTDRFKIGIDTDVNNADFAGSGLRMTIIDRYNRQVLYFPASPVKPNIRISTPDPMPYLDLEVSASTVRMAQCERSLYDGNDNTYPFMRDATVNGPRIRKQMLLFLGDDDANGYINGAEQGYELPYLLWSAGPDENFGPTYDMATPASDPDNDLDKRDAAVCDDVTNFRVNND